MVHIWMRDESPCGGDLLNKKLHKVIAQFSRGFHTNSLWGIQEIVDGVKQCMRVLTVRENNIRDVISFGLVVFGSGSCGAQLNC